MAATPLRRGRRPVLAPTLTALFALALGGAAWAQGQDVRLDRVAVTAGQADLSLPADRGALTVQVQGSYDPRAEVGRTVDVALALVALRPGLGEPVEADRLPLPAQSMRWSALSPVGQPAARGAQFQVDLAPADRRAFLVAHHGDAVVVEVRLRPDVAEGRDAVANNRGHGPVPVVRPLSGVLRFGGMTATLGLRPVADQGCGAGLLFVGNDLEFTSATLLPSLNGQWDPVPVPGDVCATLEPEGDAFALKAAVGFAEPLSVTGEVGGNPVQVSGQLNHEGFVPVFGALGPRHDLSSHPDAGDRPRPRGQPLVLFGAEQRPLADLAGLGAVPTPLWLRGRDLPFSVRLSGLSVRPDGVTGTYDAVYSHEQQVYAAHDPNRARAHRRSNATRFADPLPSFLQPDRSVGLEPSGLRFAVRFNGGQGRRHFPELSQIDAAFDARVVGGRLVATDQVGETSVVFQQGGACPECGPGAGVTGYGAVSDGPVGLGSDGAELMRLTNLPSGPGFGPLAELNGVPTPVFKRRGDGARGGVLMLPGYRVAGTATDQPNVVRALLASRAPQVSNGARVPGEVHAGDADWRAGNHFFPGLTVGPQIYSDAQAQPQVGEGVDLTDTQMEVGFGGAEQPDWRTVRANLGTKYVVRRGGLTGVFNTDEPPQPQLYGFPTRLDRFGFRVVRNAVDHTSWIDGRVTVPGRGGFALDFLDLDLSCTGQVGGGALAARDCAAGINCDQRLHAWRLAYDVGGFDFPPAGGDLCAGAPRRLRTHGSVHPSALRDAIGLSATWASQGDPVEAQVTGRAHNRFDGADGFDVVLRRAVGLDSPAARPDEGWFTFRGTVGLPFWDGIATALRLEEGEAGPRPSVVVADAEALPAPFAQQTNLELADDLEANPGWHPRAHYQWGGTPIGLDLPIRYRGRPGPGEAPQFLGDSEASFDLRVLSARAGTDYVTPQRTKISFGASADFEKVRAIQVDLHLDLEDPASVQRADSFLVSVVPGLGLDAQGRGPIGQTVGALTSVVPSLRRYTGAGFDDLLAEGLDGALDAAQPGFEALADALTQVQALPALVSQGVLDAPRARAAQITARFDARLAADLALTVQTLPTVGARVALALDASAQPAPEDLDALQDVVDALDRVNGAIDVALGGLAELEREMQAARLALNDPDDPNDLSDQVRARVAAAQAQLDQMRARLTPGDPQALPIFDCQVAPGGNPMLAQVLRLEQELDQATQALQNNALLSLAAAIVDATGVDLSGVTAAQTEIRDAAQGLAQRLDQANASVRAAVNASCGELQAVAAQARGLLGDVKTDVDALGQRYEALVAVLDGFFDDFGDLLDLARGRVSPVQTALGGLVADVRALAAGAVRVRFQSPAVAIEADLQALLMGSEANFSFYVDAQANLVVELRAALLLPVDQVVNQMVLAVGSALAETVEQRVVLLTAAELRRLVAQRILGSAAVAQLDQAFQASYALVVDELEALIGRFMGQANHFLREVTRRLSSRLNEALAAATSALNQLPVTSAEMDGYATVRGGALERLHIDAAWTAAGDGPTNSTTYRAGLDITAWGANGKGAACDPGAEGAGIVDAVISAFDLPVTLGGDEVMAKQVSLGLTLDGAVPEGAFGGLDLRGPLSFQAFTLYDLGLQVGVGVNEAYVGARGLAAFDDVSLEAAFLVGATCNNDVLTALDPQAAEFLELDGGLRGAYVRGGASLPVWDNGCALTVGVGADAGAWALLDGGTFRLGGLVGGSAWGKALCIASLRGGVTTYGELAGGRFRFRGEGFGVAGLGFDCDPHTWTSVSRSRGDGWCGTGDARFDVTYEQGEGFDVSGVSPSAIH